METEIWKPIPGYEGIYEASSAGRIRSLDRRAGQKFARGTIIRPSSDGGGYTSFSLCRGNSKERAKTHRAVCLTFNGPPLEGQCVRHLNVAHGTRGRLTPEDVLAIRGYLNAGKKVAVVAAEFGISRTHAHRISTGRSWRDI